MKKVKRRTSKQVYKIWDATRYNQKHQARKWNKDGGDVKFRYSYPLDKDSVVFDVGGYEGEWAKKIYDKYHCKIYVFEPVKEYEEHIKKLFNNNKRVEIFSYGLSGKTRSEKISIEEFNSSIFKTGAKTRTIQLIDIIEFCAKNNIEHIDLIKINIEGGEYELLERILETDFIQKIDRLQIQFHEFVLNGELRMENIQRKLSKTHKPTYQYWFVWENWIRKGLKN